MSVLLSSNVLELTYRLTPSWLGQPDKLSALISIPASIQSEIVIPEQFKKRKPCESLWDRIPVSKPEISFPEESDTELLITYMAMGLEIELVVIGNLNIFPSPILIGSVFKIRKPNGDYSNMLLTIVASMLFK